MPMNFHERPELKPALLIPVCHRSLLKLITTQREEELCYCFKQGWDELVRLQFPHWLGMMVLAGLGRQVGVLDVCHMLLIMKPVEI